jgi:hypothetical protein
MSSRRRFRAISPPGPTLPAAHPAAVPRHDAAIAEARIVVAIVEGRVVVEPVSDPANPPTWPAITAPPGNTTATPAWSAPPGNTTAMPAWSTPPGNATAPSRATPGGAAATTRAAPGGAAAAPDLHDHRVVDCRLTQACRTEGERRRRQRRGDAHHQSEQCSCQQKLAHHDLLHVSREVERPHSVGANVNVFRGQIFSKSLKWRHFRLQLRVKFRCVEKVTAGDPPRRW